MELGQKIPPIHFNATSNLQANFANYQGRYIILYFYPKDATSGCTTEGQEFRDAFAHFNALNAIILGVSRDNLSSHQRFKEKQQFPFELISDGDEQLCQSFDVIKMKAMYGKQVRGIERSTFIIAPDGTLAWAWRKVKVKGHVAEVLSTLQHLSQAPPLT